MDYLKKNREKYKVILDIGCGPMFVSYSINRLLNSEYIGIDIMPVEKLKKYRDAMVSVCAKSVEVIRASAESLPFRNNTFDFALALDVLEHLRKPREALMEIYRVIKVNSMVAVSLPLENLFQRLCRVGFILMRIFGDPILKRAKRISITRTPDYHYVGNVKSYGEMLRMLRELFNPFHIRYTPIGFHKSINVNAVHILKKKS
jgi:ubiquinone/menaquinone biosynthesis C-methylase UbiE